MAPASRDAGGPSPIAWLAHRSVPSQMRLDGPNAEQLETGHECKFFFGLDVHKDFSIAIAELGSAGARHLGSIAHDLNALLKVLAKYGDASHVRVVYEAGPTGFGLYRALRERGYDVQVIAPSMIPRRASDQERSA